jgi:hypothetical protein
MTTGILLLALQHPYYGCMALNLALSIRYQWPDVPIAIVVDAKGAERLRGFRHHFDRWIELDTRRLVKKGQVRPFLAKTLLYEHSPWQQTLYLDSDTVLFRPQDGAPSIQSLVESLKGIAYTPMVLSKASNTDCLWGASTTTLRTEYAIASNTEFYEVNSSLMYFEKGEVAASIFRQAEEIYRTPRTDHATFAGDMPDELAFEVAAALSDWQPNTLPFKPILNWSEQQAGWNLPSLMLQHNGVTMLGARLSPAFQQLYNRLAVQYNYAVGNSLVYKWQDKCRWASHRTHQ